MAVVALASPTRANAGSTQMRLPASLVQPDLILRSAAARLAPGCEREVPVAVVTIEVANTGNGPSGAIAGAASYSFDGAASFTPTHPSESLATIAAGASATHTMNVILTEANAGSHKFRIVVNPQHNIAETDFTNNTSPTLDVVVPAGHCTRGHTNANTAQETATAQKGEGKLAPGPPIAEPATASAG